MYTEIEVRMTPEEAGYQKVLVDYLQLGRESFERNAAYYCQFTPLDKLDFSKWYAGHYHVESEECNVRIMFEDYDEICDEE